MKAMILCAGRGERLRPLTDHTPKPLLPAGPKRLVEHLITALAHAGIDQLVINHAHLGSQFPQLLGDGSRYGVTIDYAAEGSQGLETAGGIINALPLLGDEPFMVINGDIWTDYPFARLLTTSLENTLCHLVLVDNPAHNPQGDFVLDADNTLQLTGEPRFTFSGIGLYRPEMFAGYPAGKRALKPLFIKAIEQHKASAELYRGDWSDIGSEQRLQQLRQRLAE